MNRRELMVGMLVVGTVAIVPAQTKAYLGRPPSVWAPLEYWRAYLLPDLWTSFPGSIGADIEISSNLDALWLRIEYPHGGKGCVLLTRKEIVEGLWPIACRRMHNLEQSSFILVNDPQYREVSSPAQRPQ